MLETRVLQHITEIATLLPMISIIYKVYFSKPKIYNKESILSLSKTGGEIILIGTSEVSPPGANKNYTLDVKSDGTGILQITHPDNKVSQVLSADDAIEGNTVELKGDRQQTFLITEQNTQKQNLLFGALVYKP